MLLAPPLHLSLRLASSTSAAVGGTPSVLRMARRRCRRASRRRVADGSEEELWRLLELLPGELRRLHPLSPAASSSSPGRTRKPTVLQYAASGAQHGWNTGRFAVELPSLSFLQTPLLQMQIGEVAGDSLSHAPPSANPLHPLLYLQEDCVERSLLPLTNPCREGFRGIQIACYIGPTWPPRRGALYLPILLLCTYQL
jgi:hypothetical protein